MNVSNRASALARVEQGVLPSLSVVPAHFALNFRPILCVRPYDAAVDLDGFFLVELVFTVVSVVHLVPLLDWRGTPVNNALFFEVQICWLVLGPVVLDVELQPTELDGVSSGQPMVMQEGVFILICVVTILLLRFEVSNDNKHHVAAVH